jgi:co-chaperonin GroES (HSP10)
MNTVKGTIKPLKDKILVVDMDFEEQKTASGIIIQSDDGKGHGVKPRWAKVWAVGPEQEEVSVGEWVYVEHGRWTRGITVADPSREGEEVVIRMIEPKAIMLQADEKPSDAYLGIE